MKLYFFMLSTLATATQYHLPSMSGCNGALSYISSPRNSFLGVILTRNQIATVQLHGFSDASKNAYAPVVYLQMINAFGKVQISLVTAKTKVAPIKKLTIPRLELCGAYLLAQLLSHVKDILEVPLHGLIVP